MNECMNEGRLNYKLIPMCVSAYVSLLHDSASGGARTALAPCLETWLATWLAPGGIVLTCYDMTATTSWFTILCEQAVSAWPRHSDE